MGLSEELDGSLLEKGEEGVISTQKLSLKNESFQRIYDTKWKTLTKLGYTKPRTFEENRERARQAHAGA